MNKKAGVIKVSEETEWLSVHFHSFTFFAILKEIMSMHEGKEVGLVLGED